MEFEFPAEAERFREELRAFMDEELPDWWMGLFHDDDRIYPFTKEFCMKLAERDWLTSLPGEHYLVQLRAASTQAEASSYIEEQLEGAGASKFGSVFIYMLVAAIGAGAEFRKVVDAPALVAIGGLWMAFHAGILLFARRLLKAPIFFAAVGSKANVGGAASAPIVASAFHPALAPVGVLLAIGGYVLGTYAALGCMVLLKLVAGA